MHPTATGSIGDVSLCYRTIKVSQSGLVPVQTQAFPEKPSYRVPGVLEKREWKAPASVSRIFVTVNGKNNPCLANHAVQVQTLIQEGAEHV